MRQISLDQVHIPKACPASWDSMHGNDGRRFCDICQKDVHNIAALPRAEGTALVNSGHACVRVLQDARGHVMSSEDYPLFRIRTFLNRRGFRLLSRFALLTATLFLTACKREGRATAGTPQPAPSTPNVTTIMGEMVFVPPAGVDGARVPPAAISPMIVPLLPSDGIPNEWLGKISRDVPVEGPESPLIRKCFPQR